jgi:galacturan 1,4-alpha-galacturonidase
LGHNTDAFDVHGTSNDITIKNANILNQDDCLAVNSGSKIRFLYSKCVGGHGISIGSIRSGSKVDGVTVSNCIVSDSENGVRIKTWDGESGASVRNVQYSNITLNAIDKMGIVVRQDYLNDGPTGRQARGSITIEGLVMRGIKGTVVGKANSVYINCSPGMCKNWQMSDISVKGGSITCMEAPAGARPPCPH